MARGKLKDIHLIMKRFHLALIKAIMSHLLVRVIILKLRSHKLEKKPNNRIVTNKTEKTTP